MAAPAAAAAAPSAAVHAALERAHADNPAGHIYTQILERRARIRAQALDACWAAHAHDERRRRWPLAGVPLAVKDNIDVGGTGTSGGRRAAPEAAAADAAIVRILEALGAVTIGKTNLDAAALGATGRNPLFGRCVNPRDARLSSGGSSSGSAAAVAAGHVLLGVGTDTLGSVRIPAAFCRIAAFKPSHGRLSTAGVMPLYPRFDTVGILAASLADVACAAALLLPPDPAQRAESRTLHLLFLDAAALAGMESVTADQYRRCLDALRATGTVHLTPMAPVDYAAIARAALWEVAHEFATCSAAGAPGYFAPDEAESELGALLARALSLQPARLQAGRALLRDAGSRLQTSLATADALLTPTCPGAATPADAAAARDVAAFAAPANVAGLPAVCWPQATGACRSLSVQLVGRRGDDRRLLDMAVRIGRLLDRGQPPATVPA